MLTARGERKLGDMFHDRCLIYLYPEIRSLMSENAEMWEEMRRCLKQHQTGDCIMKKLYSLVRKHALVLAGVMTVCVSGSALAQNKAIDFEAGHAL